MPPPLPPLTPQEIASFVRDGYLIKRRVLDPALCAQARDVLWAHNEAPHKLRRGDPSTYFGPWDYKDEQRDGDNVRKHYRWHLHKVGNDQLFVDLVGGATHKYAEQLLGVGECTPPRGSGGIYCTLPRRKAGGDCRRPYLAHPLQAHVDASLDAPQRLNAVGYIDDVPPGSGAFGVWGGSHRRVWNLLLDSHTAAQQPGRDDLRGVAAGSYCVALDAELERLVADTPPTDCWGFAGDVVLYHARLVHVPMFNYGTTIRQAVISGFAKNDAALPPDDSAARLAHVEHGDLWEDWAPQVRGIAAATLPATATVSGARL